LAGSLDHAWTEVNTSDFDIDRIMGQVSAIANTDI